MNFIDSEGFASIDTRNEHQGRGPSPEQWCFIDMVIAALLVGTIFWVTGTAMNQEQKKEKVVAQVCEKQTPHNRKGCV